jgi:DNA topoisomerase IA
MCLLASDPDREGEAIAWHVLEALKEKKALGHADVQRITFNEITKSAVLEAIKHPRELDQPLIDAYMARRALDYLVGFHPVAGAVAQAAGRPLGRAGAVGRAAPDLRTRVRN